MSVAAKELFMTQPGVSQHIRTIEDVLGLRLFDRISKKLIPTNDARKLFESLKPILKSLEHTLNESSSRESIFRGKVSVGIPIEFGNNIILPLLSTWAQKHEFVELSINYDHAQRQSSKLLDGSLDFAITDSFIFPDQITVQNLTNEKLVLCATKEYATAHGLNASSSYDKLKDQNFICYLEDQTVVKQWFNYHYNKKVTIGPKATLMDVEGVYRLISSGLGIGIVPMHILKKKRVENEVVIFKGNGTDLLNEINLAVLKNKSLNPMTKDLMSFLLSSMK